MDDAGMPPLHTHADRFDPGGWERPGQCICGTTLPPQHTWHGAGGDWQHVRCPACRTLVVDEGDFFVIGDDDKSLAEPCCERESTGA